MDYLPRQGDIVIWRENETKTLPAIVIRAKQKRDGDELISICSLHVFKGGHAHYVPESPVGDGVGCCWPRIQE